MTNPEYLLTFDLNVLNHLGIGLYSNVPAVLSEMVANAWDAGASQVRINIGINQIEVEDNGRGMTVEEINERYLKVGYQKRRRERTVLVGGNQRHVMGRKGIGKLSAFSVANVVEVQTASADQKHGFVMKLSEINEAISTGIPQYQPLPLDRERINVNQGTKIVLSEITNPLIDVIDELRTDLARRFSILDTERKFEIVVNGTPISLKDRSYYEKIQFMWYFGEGSEGFIKNCPNLVSSFLLNDVVEKYRDYKVTGWIGTVSKPKDIGDQHHAISIFAHGKLIQEDILSTVQDARLFRQYIIGEIDADFMDDDDEPDIITSDRQRINQNDPRYRVLVEFIAKSVKSIGNSWDDLRKQHVPKRPKQKETTPGNESGLTSKSDIVENEADSRQLDGVENQLDISINVPSSHDELLGKTPDKSGSDEVIPMEKTVDSQPRSPSPPAREAQTIFSTIRSAIDSSTLEGSFKNIIQYDLEQARLAYYNRAYKATVLMLGAVVEGLMLGTMLRPEFLDMMIKDSAPPAVLERKLKGEPRRKYTDISVFRSDLGKRLDFEDYKLVIQHYIPQTQHLGIGDVQRFRNAVHPWQCIQDPNIYGSYGAARAMAHLAPLEGLANTILAWEP